MRDKNPRPNHWWAPVMFPLYFWITLATSHNDMTSLPYVFFCSFPTEIPAVHIIGDATVVEGDVLQLTCQTSGFLPNNDTRYTWHLFSDFGRQFDVRANTSELHVSDVNYAVAGNVTCHVSNPDLTSPVRRTKVKCKWHKLRKPKFIIS